MQSKKRFSITRTGPDSAEIVIERNFKDLEAWNEMQYSYSEADSTEKYRFLIPLAELYQITQDALRASSEIIKIQRPKV